MYFCSRNSNKNYTFQGQLEIGPIAQLVRVADS